MLNIEKIKSEEMSVSEIKTKITKELEDILGNEWEKAKEKLKEIKAAFEILEQKDNGKVACNSIRNDCPGVRKFIAEKYFDDIFPLDGDLNNFDFEKCEGDLMLLAEFSSVLGVNMLDVILTEKKDRFNDCLLESLDSDYDKIMIKYLEKLLECGHGMDPAILDKMFKIIEDSLVSTGTEEKGIGRNLLFYIAKYLPESEEQAKEVKGRIEEFLMKIVGDMSTHWKGNSLNDEKKDALNNRVLMIRLLLGDEYVLSSSDGHLIQGGSLDTTSLTDENLDKIFKILKEQKGGIISDYYEGDEIKAQNAVISQIELLMTKVIAIKSAREIEELKRNLGEKQKRTGDHGPGKKARQGKSDYPKEGEFNSNVRNVTTTTTTTNTLRPYAPPK